MNCPHKMKLSACRKRQLSHPNGERQRLPPKIRDKIRIPALNTTILPFSIVPEALAKIIRQEKRS